jgi:dTMP kinase
LAYSRGLFDEQFLLEATKFAMNGLMPDNAILLKLTEEELHNRLGNKSHDRIEKQGIEYLLKVQSNIEYCCVLLGIDLLIIDASESREAIFEQISSIIKE